MPTSPGDWPPPCTDRPSVGTSAAAAHRPDDTLGSRGTHSRQGDGDDTGTAAAPANSGTRGSCPTAAPARLAPTASPKAQRPQTPPGGPGGNPLRVFMGAF